MFYHWHFMESEEIQQLILLFAIVVISLIIGLVIIFTIFNSRKNKFIAKSIQDKFNFQNEISKVKLETKDITLNEVSRELHDNIGQILAVAKMQVNIFKSKPETINEKTLAELEKIIGKSIDEIRLLTRLTRLEAFDKINLHDAISQELERINLLKSMACVFENKTDFYQFENEHELFIFRIFQEAISNIIKHAQTDKILVTATLDEVHYTLSIRDFGIGMASDHLKLGSGIKNMENRAKLINSVLTFEQVQPGTLLTLKYPIKNEN